MVVVVMAVVLMMVVMVKEMVLVMVTLTWAGWWWGGCAGSRGADTSSTPTASGDRVGATVSQEVSGGQQALPLLQGGTRLHLGHQD